MAAPRKIMHIDLDAFFCAVEEIRDPSLKGKPFAVGGRPEERGVVASCSYTARTFGIRSAMPMARAVKLCPDLIIIHGHNGDYASYSRRVMFLIDELTHSIEQISIDEAFVDLTDIPGPGEVIARALQARINRELLLPCSIGVATNKLVAKIATEYAKATSAIKDSPPNAIHIVDPGQESAFLAPLPVEMLWGVGPKTAQRLIQLGFRTIGDLATAPEKELIDAFGKMGYEISRRAKGLDDRPLSTSHTLKSISQETTFSADISDPEALEKVIKTLAHEVSQRLQRKHLEAKTIKIKVRWPDFTTINRQITLQHPTSQKDLISDKASELFRQVWRSGRSVRLLGVGVSGLQPLQLRLWENEFQGRNKEKVARLKAVLDDLKSRYGERIIAPGSEFDRE